MKDPGMHLERLVTDVDDSCCSWVGDKPGYLTPH
jgi:hypothetical protein